MASNNWNLGRIIVALTVDDDDGNYVRGREVFITILYHIDFS